MRDLSLHLLDLAQNSNPEDIEAWIEEVFTANPDMLESYRKGKTNVVKAMTGAVMAASKGKANPVMLKTLLENPELLELPLHEKVDY